MLLHCASEHASLPGWYNSQVKTNEKSARLHDTQQKKISHLACTTPLVGCMHRKQKEYVARVARVSLQGVPACIF